MCPRSIARRAWGTPIEFHQRGSQSLYRMGADQWCTCSRRLGYYTTCSRSSHFSTAAWYLLFRHSDKSLLARQSRLTHDSANMSHSIRTKAMLARTARETPALQHSLIGTAQPSLLSLSFQAPGPSSRSHFDQRWYLQPAPSLVQWQYLPVYRRDISRGQNRIFVLKMDWC